jgi:hypothetical protein
MTRTKQNTRKSNGGTKALPNDLADLRVLWTKGLLTTKKIQKHWDKIHPKQIGMINGKNSWEKMEKMQDAIEKEIEARDKEISEKEKSWGTFSSSTTMFQGYGLFRDEDESSIDDDSYYQEIHPMPFIQSTDLAWYYDLKTGQEYGPLSLIKPKKEWKKLSTTAEQQRIVDDHKMIKQLNNRMKVDVICLQSD